MDEDIPAPEKRNTNPLGAILLVCLLCGIGVYAYPSRRITTCGRGPSLSQAIAIESAVNNFQTEYGVLPDIGERVQTDGPVGVGFLTILLGMEDTSAKIQNTRSVKFLSVRETKKRRNGLLYSDDGKRVQGLYDEWGNPYIVEINLTKDAPLRFTYGARNVEPPGRLIAIYTAGPDKKPGTGDDIRTW